MTRQYDLRMTDHAARKAKLEEMIETLRQAYEEFKLELDTPTKMSGKMRLFVDKFRADNSVNYGTLDIEGLKALKLEVLEKIDLEKTNLEGALILIELSEQGATHIDILK